MKKFQWIYFAVLALGLLTCGGCSSTEVIDNEPETPSQSKIRVTISTNDYTRADVTNESTISSLYLAFYEGDTFKGIVKATGSDKAYTCDVPLGVKPDGVIAFANISEEQANAINGDNIFNTTITDLADASSNMVMSSSRYFDAEGNDMVKTPISAANLIENGDPVAINLDRVAAKVSVINSISSPTKIKLTRGDGNGDASLTLKDLKWGLTGTEKESYLIKNLGGVDISNLNSELAGWSNWNEFSKKVSHWAHSKSWDDNVYPDGTTQGGTYKLYYSSINDINSSISTIYCHETTKSKDAYTINNALASMIIVGQYDISELASGTTFFVDKNNNFYTEDQYMTAMFKVQDILFPQGSKPNYKDHHSYFKLSHPKGYNNLPLNYVTLQMNPDVKISTIPKNKEQTDYWTEQDRDKINQILAEECEHVQMFEKGQCYFIVPIQHMAFSNEESAKNVTGSYGLVRNHHYNITINSISGLGNGVISTTSSGNPFIPLSYTYSGETEKQYKVNATVNINNWSEVNQEINIPK